MKYTYYPGCSLHSTAKEYDQSTQSVCRALDIELQEIPDWSCCGASSAHSLNHELGLALSLRNLAKAEQLGLDVAIPCAACFNRLKSADAAVKDNATLQQSMSKKMGIEYKGSLRVISLLEAIAGLGSDNIKPHVRRELSGLKPACYYGCLLVRNPKVMQFDDAEHPVTLDNLMADLGAEPVAWPYKNECCGASLSISKPEIVVKLTRDILASAKRAGANCIVTACPLCQGNLDMRQPDIAAKYGEQYDMPIFYFTQLMGIALGLEKDTLGLNRLMVDPSRVLASVK